MMETSLIQNIEDLNRIPETWKVYNYEAVVSDCSSGNKKLAKSDYLKDGEIAIIDQGQRLIAGYSNDVNLKVKSKPPYIIFGDHTRAFKFIDFPFIMGADGTKVLKPKNDSCDTKYLYYFFYSLAIPNTGYNRHYKYLKNAKIPLPPLTEQKRIAAILDAADVYRQKTKALISKYDELAQSLFLDMFGDPGKNENSYRQYQVDEIASKVTDGDHATPIRQNSGYKLLSCRNIKNGFIDFNAGLDYVGEDEFKRMVKRCNPERGDILISCSGTIGRTTAIKTDEPFVLVRSAALIKPKKGLSDPLYLEYYFRTSFMQARMKRSANTSSQANLFTGPIKKLPVLLPSLFLQNQFAQRIEAIEKQKAQAEKSLAQAEDLFGSLLQRAFRGELN